MAVASLFRLVGEVHIWKIELPGPRHTGYNPPVRTNKLLPQLKRRVVVAVVRGVEHEVDKNMV